MAFLQLMENHQLTDHQRIEQLERNIELLKSHQEKLAGLIERMCKTLIGFMQVFTEIPTKDKH